MGIFDAIKHVLWKGAGQAATPSPATVNLGPRPASAPGAASDPASAPSPQPFARTPAPVAQPAAAPVDVVAILDAAVARKRQPLDWRHSIVDFMKALDLDSSLQVRKQLAKELNYTGDPNDTAAMNVWLLKALMQKLAQNGGKIPADLLR
ncbi:DUF3597 domain-containing protein [Rhodoligotrophos ferricapiens]|uniref:DUF3597 domain-containing protein n=1 Tax=Rhodoligotrophos ferricapiens TaxID=3069264 RepID=UPI00315C9E3D